jgi:hypothetical protein
LSATIERNLDEREGLRTQRPQLFSKPFSFQECAARTHQSRPVVNHENRQSVAAAPGGNEKPRA